MTEPIVLPKLDSCVELHRLAYEQYGTGPFDLTQLPDDDFDTELPHLADLAVVYGLLGFDGAGYFVTLEPDAVATAARPVVLDHADRVRRRVRETARTDDGAAETSVSNDDTTYRNVFVAESDGFEEVVETIVSVDPAARAAVVLRSIGDSANEVQQIADRLCTRSELKDTPLSIPYEKESSDVAGDDKNTLEFRLYLKQRPE